jgi:hypothetical protein
MSNARTRRNRREGIAAKAADAFAVNTQWRTNPMMRPDIATNRYRVDGIARSDGFGHHHDSAYRWDGASWVADEARERKVVRTEFDTPLDPRVAIARRRNAAVAAGWEQGNGTTVHRSTDDSAMRSKPAKRQQRGGGDAVETWASKGK